MRFCDAMMTATKIDACSGLYRSTDRQRFFQTSTSERGRRLEKGLMQHSAVGLLAKISIFSKRYSQTLSPNIFQKQSFWKSFCCCVLHLVPSLLVEVEEGD